MPDVSFPARLVVTREVDDDGLPILTATVIPAESAAAMPLPAGPAGPPGPRGATQSTFRKSGEIANAAARPTGLGPEDRGRWWHRLDTNGMDVWTGTAWQHSPDAVGPQGPTAYPNTLAVTTVHNPALTVPAVKFTGSGADQQLAVTVPAGLPGPPGPSGSSGAITEATDFDDTMGPTQRSMFGLNVGARKWRPLPPPNGFGPWSWYGAADFNAASGNVNAAKLTAGQFTVPALPFRWRPLAWAQLEIYCQQGHNSHAVGYVRLNNSNGVSVAHGAGARLTGQYFQVAMVPTFGDEGTKPLGPASTYATVPANTEATLVVTAERVGGTNSAAEIGYGVGRASLVVWAIPA
ncbi:hypothetical protein [Nocardia cyriacigeorgica]|uniref:hypothetical protein n=1 Tax=Nocardia cyriacigeorgica TaxID=135487 RepID=UPI0018956A27|nr:hypothetical protein [Nocardia cyriacigeorgica]MBF6326762.1 hypothetical protein [Nocardia cyriacigeorgica]